MKKQLEEAEASHKVAMTALETEKKKVEETLTPLTVERDALRKQLRSSQLEVTRVQASKEQL